MFDFLKHLFGSWDRQQRAAERAAVAMEDIAGDLEGIRDQLRVRLGGRSEPELIEAPAAEAKGKRKTVAAA